MGCHANLARLKAGTRVQRHDKICAISACAMGVLAPGSAHARPSAQPPIDTSGNFSAHISGGGGGKLSDSFLINFLAKLENSKHFSFFSKKN